MTPSLPTSTSGSTHGLSVVSSAAFSIGNAIKEGCCTLSRFVGKSQNLWKNVGVIAGLATVILAPVYLYKAIKTCRLIGRKPAENKMDSALHVVTNLQKTAETTGYFVMALNRIRTVVVRTFTWFTPFSIAMSVFSIPAIVTNVRSFIRTRNLIREMEAVEKNGVASGNTPLQTYRALLLHLEQKQAVNDDFISETFNVDKVKFADALVAIESDLANSDKKADGEKILNETLYLLKGRLKAKNISSIISIIASAAAIIGTAILLTASSVSAGISIMGVGVVIGLASLIQHKAAEYKFVSGIQLQRTRLEWVFC